MKKRHHFGGKTGLAEKKAYIYIYIYAYMFVFTRIILLQPMKLYLFSFQSDLVEFIALVQFSPYNDFILLNPLQVMQR